MVAQNTNKYISYLTLKFQGKGMIQNIILSPSEIAGKRDKEKSDYSNQTA